MRATTQDKNHGEPAVVPLRILLVEDSEDDAFFVVRALREGGYEPHHQRVDTQESMAEALDTGSWDIVIADYALPRFDGLRALALLKKRKLDLPFILVSGAIGEDTAVEAMKSGAHDYIMKNNLARLAPAVKRELHQARMREGRRKAVVTIRKMNEELLKANEDLKALDEMKTNLLSNVSHELRTPLVAIRGYTELVHSGHSGPVTTEQKNQLAISMRNIDRLLSLINNLLDFSNLQFGRESLLFETFDARELADEQLQDFKPALLGKKVALNYLRPAERVRVEADREKLGRALSNLLDNAVKFTPGGGRITVDIKETDGGFVEISVGDTGPGIPKAALKRIFDRFFQVDASTTRRHGGIGIGLAICRDIMTLHKGDIRVKSKEGEGTVFTLSLPQKRS